MGETLGALPCRTEVNSDGQSSHGRLVADLESRAWAGVTLNKLTQDKLSGSRGGRYNRLKEGSTKHLASRRVGRPCRVGTGLALP